MLEKTRDKILNGESVKMGLMGGTFDPIHNGHIAAAVAAYEQLDLDEVIFIPAGNPSFKQGQEITDPMDRFSMCCEAVDDYPAFGVNASEITREGVTYTADTLRQLRKGFRPNVSMVFIMGADSAQTLQRWHDQETLKELAQYAIVKRPNIDLPDHLLENLQNSGYDVVLVNVETPDVSSSEIRRKVLAGEDISDMVPEAVAQIIHEKRMYLPELQGIDNPLSEEFCEARKLELKERVNEHRFTHSLGVSETAMRLAEAYDVDVRKARIAGLLHDWDKGYNDEGIRARVDELEMDIDPFVHFNLPRVLHAHTAAAAIARDFPNVPEDVLQAMDRHTVAAADMTALDMVIYIADALEPNRSYEKADELREEIGVVSLEELFFDVYEYWIMHMVEKRMLLHPNTVDIWNHYAARFRARKKGI